METLIATANLNGVDHSLGSPTSCAAFPIIQPPSCASCSPGLGSTRKTPVAVA
jgi:hypothetical protein